MKVTPEEATVLRRLMDYPGGVDARRLGNTAPRVAALRDRGLVQGELSPSITDLGVRVWVAHVLEQAGTEIPVGLLPGS